MRSFFQDIQYELRQWRRNPAFALVTIVTLALGIGANALMFAIVDSVLLRPLQYHEADRLIALGTTNPRGSSMAVSLLNFEDWRTESQSFSAIAAYIEGRSSMKLPSGESTHVGVLESSAALFDVLQVRPALGRTFFADEDQRDKPCVVVLRNDLWREQFGGDRTALGARIAVDGVPCTVVGVMPKGFVFPSQGAAVWMPLHPAPQMINRNTDFLSVIGRLKPGVTLGAARSELTVIGRRLAAAYPAENRDTNITPYLYQDTVTSGLRPALLALLAAVGLLLLITCANVANLQLARALGRQKEMAIRAALGAGRGRLVRKLLTEKLVLALTGTAVGLALAEICLSLLKSLAAGTVPRIEEVELHPEVFLVMAGVAALTALLFGLAPIFQASRKDIEKALRESALAVTGGRGTQMVRDALVVGQLGVAIILLADSGLLLRTLYHLLHEDRGFAADHVLTLETSISSALYQGRDVAAALYSPELDGIKAIPGVKTAGFVTYLPLSDNGTINVGFSISGRRDLRGENSPTASLNAVSEDYFRVLRVPLLRGRFFETQDSLSAPRVALINDAAVRKYFQAVDPIGQQIEFGGSDPKSKPLTIVGIVRGSRQESLAVPPDPQIYISFRQVPPDTLWANFMLKRIMTFVVRTGGDPSSVSNPVQMLIRRTDPSQTVFHVQRMDEVVAASVRNRRLGLLLLGLFAALALVVGSAGLYAVLSYTVGQRRRDIAVRMAMGATRGNVLRMIMSHALLLCGIGLGLGCVGAVWCGRLMANILIGVRPWDPATLAATCAVFVLVTLLASWSPARHAASIEPVTALRME